MAWCTDARYFQQNDEADEIRATAAGLPKTLQSLELKLCLLGTETFSLQSLETCGYTSALSSLEICTDDEPVTDYKKLDMSTTQPLGALTSLCIVCHPVSGNLTAHSLTRLHLVMPQSLYWRRFAAIKTLEHVTVENLEDDAKHVISFTGCNPDCLSAIRTLELSSFAIRGANVFTGLQYEHVEKISIVIRSLEHSDLSLSCLTAEVCGHTLGVWKTEVRRRELCCTYHATTPAVHVMTDSDTAESG